jgi:Flp pilus assembly pilin Flp
MFGNRQPGRKSALSHPSSEGNRQRLLVALLVTWLQSIGEFLQAQDGQGLTEYGLILILISIVSLGVLITLGQDISNLFGQVIPFAGS